jgi:hypothetical protein
MRKLFYPVLACLLFSCSDNNKTPSGILTRKKMETVLWQMIAADEYINDAVVRDSGWNKTSRRLELYEKVFSLNKISKSEFEKSYRFYLGHPDAGKLLFDSIAAQSGRRRQGIYQSKEKAAQ